MSAVTAEALMPFPLASSANCCFHGSKPAAVLPHCAAPALLAVHASAKAVAAMIWSCPPLVIQNSFTLDACEPCDQADLVGRYKVYSLSFLSRSGASSRATGLNLRRIFLPR